MTIGGVNTWSQTAATNATADPLVNWAEGQAPSSVNDSARAMMAAVAKYRDDISGALVSTGTSTAYVLTTNQGLDATPADGSMICFCPHVTNAGGATLTADGGTTYQIQSIAGFQVGLGVLIGGTPYRMRFSVLSSGWLLEGFYGNPYNVPIGGSLLYFGSVVPNSNFAFANGAAVSRTTYAALFAIMGTTYGVGDGSTTFNLPNLSGRVPAGRESVASLLTSAFFGGDSTALGAVGGLQSHTLTTAQLAVTTPVGTISSITPVGTISQITPAGTITDGAITISGGTTGAVAGTTAVAAAGHGFADVGPTISASQSGTTFSGTPVTPTFAGAAVTPTFTGSSFGSGSAHNNVQPTIVCNYIIRII